MTKKRRARGEGSLYKRKSDGRWVCTIDVGVDHTGRRRRRTFYGKTKKEAAGKALASRADAARGHDIDAKKMTVADYLKYWIETVAQPRIAASTWKTYEGVLRLHVVPYIGGLTLARLTPARLQNLYAELEREGCGSRVREMVHGIVHKALEDAVRRGTLSRNPASVVNRPRASRPKHIALNEEQVAGFLTAARNDRHYTLYLTAVMTGLRQGELFALRWRDVDIKRGTISVSGSTTETVGNKPSLSGTKTDSSRRLVTLPKSLVEALKSHRDLMEEENHLDWVFCDTRGGIIRRSNLLRRSFKPIVRAAGLPEELRFHDLRHTAATLLLMHNEHPKVVQERLGHARISLTLDTYSHALPGLQKSAADKLDDMSRRLGIDS